jgi:DNA-binding MarR family transcriptional regulator
MGAVASTSTDGESPEASADVPTDLADRLRLSVTRLARQLRRHSDLAATPTQLSALATIERRGPLTLGDLAAHEGVQPPTVTAAVGRLEQQGLVERHVDPEDRRIVRVVVTRAGRTLLARNRSRKTAFLAQRLAALDDDERARLAAAVEVLERVLEHDADRRPADQDAP